MELLAIYQSDEVWNYSHVYITEFIQILDLIMPVRNAFHYCIKFKLLVVMESFGIFVLNKKNKQLCFQVNSEENNKKIEKTVSTMP